MLKLIKDYLKLSIETKKMLKKDLKKIDQIVKTLAQTQIEQGYLIDEYKKESYKTKFKEEHKKVKQLEKQLKELTK